MNSNICICSYSLCYYSLVVAQKILLCPSACLVFRFLQPSDLEAVDCTLLSFQFLRNKFNCPSLYPFPRIQFPFPFARRFLFYPVSVLKTILRFSSPPRPPWHEFAHVRGKNHYTSRPLSSDHPKATLPLTLLLDDPSSHPQFHPLPPKPQSTSAWDPQTVSGVLKISEWAQVLLSAHGKLGERSKMFPGEIELSVVNWVHLVRESRNCKNLIKSPRESEFHSYRWTSQGRNNPSPSKS